ncbi:hypothetical protein HMN09_00000600 [Mycena chlorophos]|uniref:F-box domain-containing protein n=1 Tax=Mycena chlorophos TaxID=658473 RepID=A0A8H6TQQ0_MYCCL|nr:hypothetical protein HMN09_00000600 [Mycena chlorophos]
MSGSSVQSRWATQLAPDVIGEILLECIPFAEETRFASGAAHSAEPRAMFPISLSHVCREWRQAAVSFKKLWSFLDVDQDATDDATRLEVYLARSGQYPLTIILMYPDSDADPTHNHAILGRLLRESSRWKTFCCDVYGLFDASPRSTGLTHAQWTALTFPELRNVVYLHRRGHSSSDSDEDDDEEEDTDEDDSSHESEGTDEEIEVDQANDTGALVEPDPPFEKLLQSLPGKVAAQLLRFYSYCTNDEYEDEMLIHLSRATRIRCAFISTHKHFWGTEPGDLYLNLPHVEYAMFATGDSDRTPNRSFLFRNELPNLCGLNLRVGREGRDVFTLYEGVPMPGYLAKLVVLRLCGWIIVTDDALTQIIDALSSLVDFTIEIRESRDVNIAHFAHLLTPEVPVIRLPRLQHLRLMLNHELPNDTLLPMLAARFTAPAEAAYARLRSFAFYDTVYTDYDDSIGSGIRLTNNRALIRHLEQVKAQNGWNIQTVELEGELWLEPLNGEFMLDI